MPFLAVRAGIVIGTHNGTIYNADYLFRRLGLPRYAEVDSELIFRLADRFAPEGPIDQEGLKKALALCRGQMSAVLASRLDPGTITVLKGNKPLCLRIHRQHRVVLYASDDAFIDFAVDNEKGWRELEVPPMTMLTIRHEDVRAIENSEFRFIPLREWRNAYSPDTETGPVDGAGQPFEPLSCGLTKDASLIIGIHQWLNQVSFQLVSLDRKTLCR